MGLAGHRAILTVTILSTTALNLSNVLRNEEIQSTRAIGLSAPLTADAVLWAGAAAMLILEMACLAASRAPSATGVPSWSSWIIHVKIWMENQTQLGEDLQRFSVGYVGSGM